MVGRRVSERTPKGDGQAAPASEQRRDVAQLLMLQRAAGNAAVGRVLQRRLGWPDAKAPSPNFTKATVGSVDRYPLYDDNLGGSTDPDKRGDTAEVGGNRVVVLVPSSLKDSGVQVLLHFHGLGDPGYRYAGGIVRDESATKDRTEDQFAKSIAESDSNMIVVMPQGDKNASFGNAITAPGAYVGRVLDLLAADGGPRLKSTGLMLSGWSAGGSRVGAIAAKDAALMQSVILFEGVNNFRASKKVDDPDHPGKTKSIELDNMGGRDKIDLFLKLIAQRLDGDVTALEADPGHAKDYLKTSFRFLAYFGIGGPYDDAHRLLDMGIREIFGEPVSKAELATAAKRLSGGLSVAAVAPKSKGLAARIGALPADVQTALRANYQVIPVKGGKGTFDDAAGTLHTLGHQNIVGSGALLDSLRKTRGQRTLAAPAAAPTP